MDIKHVGPSRLEQSRLTGFVVLVLANGLIAMLMLAVGEFACRWHTEGGVVPAARSLFVDRGPLSTGATDSLLITDDELGYKYNPTKKGINSLGIPYPEIPPDKPDDLFRILVMGDSIAQDPHGFVTMLRERLARWRDVRVEVINAAVPGYTTYQERRFLERDLLGIRPDLVILQYCLNDNYKFLHILNESGRLLVTPDVGRLLMPAGDSWFNRLLRSSYLAFEIRARLLALKLRSQSRFPWEDRPVFAAWQDQTWPDFKENLEAMRDQVTAAGARLAVVAVPIETQLRPDLLEIDRTYTLKPQAFLAKICLDGGVPLLDLFQPFLANRDRGLFTDGLHLTPQGHELALGELVRFLEQRHMLPGAAAVDSAATEPRQGGPG